MFDFLFRYPLSHFQEARLAFDLPVPVWMVATLALALTAILIISMLRALRNFQIWKMAVLGVLQLSVFGLVFLMLTQPVLVTERLVQEDNDVIFVLDGSQSMAYGEAGSPRMSQALEAFASEPLKGIEKDYQVHHYLYADNAQPLESFDSLPAPEPSSKLGESLLTILQQASSQSIGAIILATDGVDTQSESGAIDPGVLSEIAAYGVPIHTIGIGRILIPEDLEIVGLEMPSNVLPNTIIKADISIRHDTAETARVKVYDGDRYITAHEVKLSLPEQTQGSLANPAEGFLLNPAEGSSSVSTITNTSIEFDAGGQGFKNLRFVLDPLDAERNLENNTASQLLEVRNGRYRVLYVDGEPRWEYKFIRRALESDSTLDLNTLLWVSDNKFYRQGIDDASQLVDGFPTSKEQLFDYDAIIIGSVAAPRFNIDQQQMIHDFVNERGGSLLMLGGRFGLSEGSWGNSLIAQLLPARLKDVENSFIREQSQAQLTSSGIGSTMLKFTQDENENLDLWQTMPPLTDYQLLGDLKPAATALLSLDNGDPLLVTQPYGKGKATIFATGASWRWQMKLPASDDRHHRFWRQLVRSHVVSTRNKFDFKANVQGNRVELRAQINDANFEAVNDVRVTALVSQDADGTGQTQTIELKPVAGAPGTYRSVIPTNGSGVFYVDAIASQNEQIVDNARLAFSMPDDQSEFFNIRQNRDQLERLANLTGGQYWQADELEDLPLAISRSKAGITEQSRDPLWNLPILFLLLVALKLCEWLLRRQWGRI